MLSWKRFQFGRWALRQSIIEFICYYRTNGQRGLLLVGLCALLNAILYVCLLPVWEGFDEPFHFGYAQQLAVEGTLPIAGTSVLSQEIKQSLLLTPGSHIVKNNLPFIVSYEEYFTRPHSARAAMRNELRSLPNDLRLVPSDILNYEAHQPPLGYVFLAIPEYLFRWAPLVVRVIVLRMCASLAGAAILLLSALLLFSQLGIRRWFSVAALYAVLSGQMTWATVSHIANDWLAVPLAVLTLVGMNLYITRPSMRSCVLLATVMSAGLLTKAYFLVFVPVGLWLPMRVKRFGDCIRMVFIMGVLALPWYLRNMRLYGVVSGTQEARGGVDTIAVLRNIGTVNWVDAMWSTMHSSLWTGNNSFITFSSATLDLLLLFGGAALSMWAFSRHGRLDAMCSLYCIVFLMALAYALVSCNVYTHSSCPMPSPWYAQVLSTPTLGLAFLGASRWKTLGRIVATGIFLLYGYIAIVTYAVKLPLLYGGYDRPINAKILLENWGDLSRRLGDNLIVPVGIVYGLVLLVVAFTLWALWTVLSGLWGEREEE